MENTARDFWKMIVDYKVSAIVMLCGEEARIHREFILCTCTYNIVGLLLSILDWSKDTR